MIPDERAEPGATPRDGARRQGLALLALGGLAALAAYLNWRTFHAMDVTGAGFGRDFRLRDPAGRVRTLAEFRGRAVLLFFGFTQCPDICPSALTRAAAVMQALGPQAARLQVIFVTVDPERDTPEVLAGYTRAFHPDFLGLWSDLETTAATAREFKVFFAKVPTGSSYTIDHSTISYAFDPRGQLRLAIGHQLSAEQVTTDLRRLL